MCLATRVHEPNAGVAIVCCMCPSWGVAAIQRCRYSPSAGARRLEHPVAPGAPCGASWEVSLPRARIPQMRCESPAPAVVHHCAGLETRGLLTRIHGIHETAGVRLQWHAALSGSRLIRSSPQAGNGNVAGQSGSKRFRAGRRLVRPARELTGKGTSTGPGTSVDHGRGTVFGIEAGMAAALHLP
jgi:hypothetical protein